jgi:hypothetical protein
MSTQPSARSHYFELIKPYASWAALMVFVVGTFIGLTTVHVLLPLMFLGCAVALVVFRYWESLKIFDIWTLREWVRSHQDAIGVRHWHAPHYAADHYCNPAVVNSRNEAAAEMNIVMMGLIKSPDRRMSSQPGESISTRPVNSENDAKHHTRYDAAQLKYNQCSLSLAADLHDQLKHGHLLAKGLLLHASVAGTEHIIPTSRWSVMSLDIVKGEASGGGWNYTDLLIGKKPVSLPKQISITAQQRQPGT